MFIATEARRYSAPQGRNVRFMPDVTLLRSCEILWRPFKSINISPLRDDQAGQGSPPITSSQSFHLHEHSDLLMAQIPIADSRSKASAVFRRTEKGSDHLRLQVVTAELIQLVYPAVKTVEVVVGCVVWIPS